MTLFKWWRYCLMVLMLSFSAQAFTPNNQSDFTYYVQEHFFNTYLSTSAGANDGADMYERPIQQAFQSLNDIGNWNRRVKYIGRITNSTDINCTTAAGRNIVTASSACGPLGCYQESDVTTCSGGNRIITIRVTKDLQAAGSTWVMQAGITATPGRPYCAGGSINCGQIEVGQAALRVLTISIGASSTVASNCITSNYGSPSISTDNNLNVGYVYSRNRYCEEEIQAIGTRARGYQLEKLWETTITYADAGSVAGYAGTELGHVITRGIDGSFPTGGMGGMSVADSWVRPVPLTIGLKTILKADNQSDSNELFLDRWDGGAGSFIENWHDAGVSSDGGTIDIQSYFRPQIVFDSQNDRFWYFAIVAGDGQRISYWISNYSTDSSMQTWTYLGHVRSGPWCGEIGFDAGSFDNDMQYAVTGKQFSASYNRGQQRIYVAYDQSLTGPRGCVWAPSPNLYDTNETQITSILANGNLGETQWEGASAGIEVGSTGPMGFGCNNIDTAGNSQSLPQDVCTLVITEDSNNRNLVGGFTSLDNCSKQYTLSGVVGCQNLSMYPVGGSCFPGHGANSSLPVTPGYTWETRSDFTPSVSAGPNPYALPDAGYASYQGEVWYVTNPWPGGGSDGGNIDSWVGRSVFSPYNVCASTYSWSYPDFWLIQDPDAGIFLEPNVGPSANVRPYRSTGGAANQQQTVIFGGIERPLPY